nr:hypothetical protein [Aeromicrobium sp. Root495]
MYSSSGVGRAAVATAHEVVPAREDVSQERLGRIELVLLVPDVLEVSLDHLGPSSLVAVEDQSDRRQAEADALTGSNDPEPTDVLLGVVAVPCGGPIGDDHSLVLPVAQDVDGNPGPGGHDSDLHPSMMAS